MKKLWPVLIVLAVLGGVGFLGYDYAEKKVELRQAKDDLRQAQSDNEKCLRQAQADKKQAQGALRQAQGEIDRLRKEVHEDSLLVMKQVADLQGVILKLREDRDYWKDFAEKMETGLYCIERQGILRKKVLVPCKKEE